jgi:CubicO group peptidase (beta-lactamase class C family)
MKRLLLLAITMACLGMQAARADTASASVEPAQAVTHELAKADADAWLDGFMPLALTQNDIAGGVVVIVKDGQVLTERGFGYADIALHKRVDPETTLFRIGSVSKLFTWTAVMQLQEQGKIDLDADVNRYLDFKIAPFEGKPVTMRQLMTHTAGFEEAIKGGNVYSGTAPILGDAVKELEPGRVFTPGATPAYSNYGASLAGYIVERVSGQSFEEYVQQHVFKPLKMDLSTTVQSLPQPLAPFMSQGYERASSKAQPFEVVSVSPAGGISSSAADMAKFMIANLAQGAGLLKPATLEQMWTPSPKVFVPGLNRMGLGYYQQNMNGRQVVGHGGDLRLFHSYLWLVPASNVGVFVSLNSAGTEGSNWTIRQALFEQFADRYFPAADSRALVELPTAKAHAEQLAGSYVSSRAWFTDFMSVLNLFGQVRIEVGEDGRPVVPDPLGGPPVKWIETEPYVWHAAYGHQRLGATVEDGKVVRWSLDAVSPFMVWDRVAWYADAAWIVPSLIAAVLVILLTAISWPIGALVRRRYKAGLPSTGGGLAVHRAVKSAASLGVLAIASWTAVFLASEPLASGTIDWVIRTAEVLSAVSAVALLGASFCKLWNAFTGSTTRFAKLFALVFAVAALLLVWVMLASHLIGFGVRY